MARNQPAPRNVNNVVKSTTAMVVTATNHNLGTTINVVTSVVLGPTAVPSVVVTEPTVVSILCISSTAVVANSLI